MGRLYIASRDGPPRRVDEGGVRVVAATVVRHDDIAMPRTSRRLRQRDDVTESTIESQTLDSLQAIDRDFAAARFDRVIERADELGPAGGPVAQAFRLAATGLRLEAQGRAEDAATHLEQALALDVPLPGLLEALERYFRRTGRAQLSHYALLSRDLHDPAATDGSMYGLPQDQKSRYATWAVRKSMAVRDPDLYGLADLKAALSDRHGPEGAATVLASVHARGQRRHAVSVQLRPLQGYAQEQGREYAEPIPAATVSARWPTVFGEAPRQPYAARSRTLFRALLDDIVVSGKSNVLLARDVALHDVQGDELTRIPVDLRVDPLVSAHEGHTAIVSAPVDRATLRRIPEAIWLGGVHSGAFGHWIIEFLPKVWSLMAGSERAGVPVLIDRQMPRQHVEALRFFAGSVRPIVIEPGEQVLVDRLWIASQLVYMPVGPLPGINYEAGMAVIDPGGLKRLLEPFQARLEAVDDSREVANLYLARAPRGRRQLLNADEIETLVRGKGYRAVRLEDLAFSRQMQLVRGAERIVGPDGSAFLMTLFGHEDLRVGLLSHPYLEEFEWFTQALDALGPECTVLTGPVIREDPTYRTFSDYRMDPIATRIFLDAFEQQAEP